MIYAFLSFWEVYSDIDINYETDISKKVLLSGMSSTSELGNTKILKQTQLSISPIVESEWIKILEIASS